MMNNLAGENNGGFVQLGLEKLDIRLKRLRSAPKSKIQNMVMSLKKHGQLTPVIVIAEGSCYILIDGFKRHMAADMLGFPGLRATIIKCDSALGKAQMYLLNRSTGFDFIEECLLVHELVEKEGLSQVEAATMLGKDKSWVNRRIHIIGNLCPQVVENIKLGLIPCGSAASLARLQSENQVAFDRVFQCHDLKSHECKQLIDLWCEADDEKGRKFLMDFPRKALSLFKSATSGTGVDDICSHLPVRVGQWFTIVKTLGRAAGSLLRQSQKPLNIADEKICRVFSEKLVEVERDCRHALTKAGEALSCPVSPVHGVNGVNVEREKEQEDIEKVRS